jgi:hypothetical protein
MDNLNIMKDLKNMVDTSKVTTKGQLEHSYTLDMSILSSVIKDNVERYTFEMVDSYLKGYLRGLKRVSESQEATI